MMARFIESGHALTPKEKARLLTDLLYPQGTWLFDMDVGNLFDGPGRTLFVLEEWSGQMYFRVERDGNLMLHFFQSSPGMGTRCASVSLEPLIGSKAVRIGLTWSPAATGLFVC